MARITFQGRPYESDGRSVLDCLAAHGQAIPSACRAGVCQSCLMQARSGTVPERAQHGLGEAQRARGLFLACQCVPEAALEVALADAVGRVPAEVVGKHFLNDDILALRLRPQAPYAYRAGQFLRLYANAGESRNYSLASVPALDDALELHVRRIPGGLVSGWIAEHLLPGDVVQVSEALGNGFYVPGRPEQNLLLIGTGSGLAPLYGIVRDALHAGHEGRILLFHGSPDARGLYLVEELRRLAASHPNFEYQPCVSVSPALDGEFAGNPVEAALRRMPDLAGWRIYLCGNPAMVETARLETFLAGAASGEIFADPFLPSAPAPVPVPVPAPAQAPAN